MSGLDDVAIGGGGSYNINWDELENMDPFNAIPPMRKSNFGKNSSSLISHAQPVSSLNKTNDKTIDESENSDQCPLVLPPPPASQLSIDPSHSVRNSVCDFPSPPSPQTMENSIVHVSCEGDVQLTAYTQNHASELPTNDDIIKTSSFSVDSGLDNSPHEIQGKSLTSSDYESPLTLPCQATAEIKKENVFSAASQNEINEKCKILNHQSQTENSVEPKSQEETSQPDSDGVMNLSQDSLSDNSYNRVRRKTFDKIETENQNESFIRKENISSSFTSQKETNSSQDSFMSTNEEIPTEADSSVYTSVSSNLNITINNADNAAQEMTGSFDDHDLTPNPHANNHLMKSDPILLENCDVVLKEALKEDDFSLDNKNVTNAYFDSELPTNNSTTENTPKVTEILFDNQALQTIPVPPEAFPSSINKTITSASTGIQTDKCEEAMPINNMDLVLGNNQDFQEKEQQLKEKIASLQEDNRQLSGKVTELNSNIIEMTHCVKEYEHTFKQLAEDKTRADFNYEQSVKSLTIERDQALEDLFTMEKAFGDLHRRFEKTKQVIDSFKQNETIFNKCIADHQDKLKRYEQKYETLKQHAEERLNIANDEISDLRRTKEAEIAKLQAALKMSELQEASLHSQLNQKVIENNELTKICDELISKCGT